MLTSDQILEQLTPLMSKANVAERAKILSMALSASKDNHERILGVARHYFVGADLNEQLLKTLQADELIALANLMYREKKTSFDFKTFDTILQSKPFSGGSDQAFTSLRLIAESLNVNSSIAPEELQTQFENIYYHALIKYQ